MLGSSNLSIAGMVIQKKFSQQQPQFKQFLDDYQSPQNFYPQQNVAQLTAQAGEFQNKQIQALKFQALFPQEDWPLFQYIQQYFNLYELQEVLALTPISISKCSSIEKSELKLNQYGYFIPSFMIEDIIIQSQGEEEENNLYIRQVKQKELKTYEGIYEYSSCFSQLQKKYYQVIFKNHLLLIKYLAKKSRDFQYIAKYYFDQSKVKKQRVNNQIQYQQFQLKMSKGDSSFLIKQQNKTNQRYINMLWNQGSSQVLKYIRSLINGVVQLQKKGIFHADLQLRNTIKVNSSYKIIDFDYAFKVFTVEHERKQLLAPTLQLFQLWLKQNEQIRKEGYLINFLFRQISDYKQKYKHIQQIYEQIYQTQRSLDSIENKKNKLCELLKRYMFFHHREKLVMLLVQIFKYRKGFERHCQILLSQLKQVDIAEFDKNIRGYGTIISIIYDLQLHTVT